MNFKKLLGGGLLATVLALGVGAGLASNGGITEAKAYDNRLHIVGTNQFGGWTTSGAVRLDDGGTSNVGLKENLNITTADTQFKIAYIDGGDIQWGWDNYGSMAMDNRTYTFANDAGGNINLKFVGQYNIFLTNGYKVYMSRNLTISFDAGTGGSVLPSSKTVTQSYSGDSVNVYGDLPTPTRDGFHFEGWFTESSGGDEVTSSSSTYSLTDNQTLYAHWSNNPEVTKYAVLDGVKQNTPIGTDVVAKGATYDVPDSIRRDDYHFGGWFTDADCLETHRYTARALNSDLDLYAKYTTFSKNSYIYYLEDKATSNNIYTWGGENEFGETTGKAINTVGSEVHGVLNFEGRTQYIYKIEFSSEAADTMVQFYFGSWADKSAEMQLTSGAAYWWSGTNADAGAAIDLLLDIEDARNHAAQYQGLNYSICGITKTVASTLVGRYDALTSDGKGFIDDTDTYTYDPSKSASESPSQMEVSYSLIIAKLREIANGTEPNINPRSISLFGDIDNSTPIMLVVIISVVSLTAVGGYIFLKRRKEN